MYSLGNFISNQYGGTNGDWNKLIGFMATLDITKTVTKDKNVKMTFDNLGGELIFTKYNGNPVTTAVHDGHTVIPFIHLHCFYLELYLLKSQVQLFHFFKTKIILGFSYIKWHSWYF